ncbi:MAG: putative SnoaL-like aldol condensation-catalyzing enzyme [Alteromonadaceae bacterium]|jgi:predicted SnoaL-like aldol condensation-catalyzing enzyme
MASAGWYVEYILKYVILIYLIIIAIKNKLFLNLFTMVFFSMKSETAVHLKLTLIKTKENLMTLINMKLINLLKFRTITALLVMSLCSLSSYANVKTKINNATNEAIVVEFFNKIFNEKADVEATSMEYLTEDYIQHNPGVATGRAAFISAIGGWLSYVPTQVAEIKRVITAGDLVMLHVHYHDTASKDLGSAVIDIFRVNKGGLITEHWDVSQAIPAEMAHENGMF